MTKKPSSFIKENADDVFAHERSYCVISHIVSILEHTQAKYAIHGRVTEIIVIWRETRNWFDMEINFMRKIFERVNAQDLLKTLEDTSDEGQKRIDERFGKLVEMAMAVRNTPPIEM